MTGQPTPPRDRLAKALRGKYDSDDHRPSYRAADAVLPVVEAETAALRQRAEQAEELLRELVDPDECHYDHNGHCQAHYLDKEPCPVARAKELLAALDRPEGT